MEEGLFVLHVSVIDEEQRKQFETYTVNSLMVWHSLDVVGRNPSVVLGFWECKCCGLWLAKKKACTIMFQCCPCVLYWSAVGRSWEKVLGHIRR